MPPKQRKKREAQLTTLVQPYLRAHLPTCLWEAKVAQKRKNGDRLCRSQVEMHQWSAARMATHGVLCVKIADEGLSSKPADGFILRGERSFLVCFFGRNFYVCDTGLLWEWFKTEASISEEEFERMSEYKGTL